jgi:iron complex outermembrane receptor protein
VQSDAPGAVSIIDRAMISASGARNIHELFRLVPGFQVGMHTGNQPLVGYHGLSDEAPRRMLVQVDGRSVYSPYFIAGVEWNQIGVDIDDIERIEVFRGSNSATYGSNAFLGVANIITRAVRNPRHPRALPGRRRRRQRHRPPRRRQLGDVACASRRAQLRPRLCGLNDWRKPSWPPCAPTGRRTATTASNSRPAGRAMSWAPARRTTSPTPNGSSISTSFGLLRWRHAPAPARS